MFIPRIFLQRYAKFYLHGGCNNFPLLGTTSLKNVRFRRLILLAGAVIKALMSGGWSEAYFPM